jgi:hypothetical protein
MFSSFREVACFLPAKKTYQWKCKFFIYSWARPTPKPVIASTPREESIPAVLNNNEKDLF